MAVNVDKSVYQAPIGLDAEPTMEDAALSIEIENPDSVTLDDGSMEITITPGKESNDEFNANLAEELDEDSNEQNKGKILKCLSQMKETDIQLIEMRFFEKRSFKEIGEIIGLTENNAKVKTFRALLKLKELFNKTK